MKPTYDIPLEQLEGIDLSNCTSRIDNEQEIYCMPAVFEVCGRCRGTGSIDCFPNGVPEDYFHEDPDFHEDYFNGVYDKSCTECNGMRVVPEPDPITDLDKTVLEAHHEWLKDIADMNAIYAAERRMGA